MTMLVVCLLVSCISSEFIFARWLGGYFRNPEAMGGHGLSGRPVLPRHKHVPVKKKARECPRFPGLHTLPT